MPIKLKDIAGFLRSLSRYKSDEDKESLTIINNNFREIQRRVADKDEVAQKIADATTDALFGSGTFTNGNIPEISGSRQLQDSGLPLNKIFTTDGGEISGSLNVMGALTQGGNQTWHQGNLIYEYSTYNVEAWGSQVAGSPTYAWRNGWYVRIGRGVMFGGRVGFSNLGGMQGEIRLSLPFTASNFGAVAIGSMTNWSGQGSMSPRGHFDSGNAYFILIKVDSNPSLLSITHSDLQNDTYIYGFSGVMLVSS